MIDLNDPRLIPLGERLLTLLERWIALSERRLAFEEERNASIRAENAIKLRPLGMAPIKNEVQPGDPHYHHGDV